MVRIALVVTYLIGMIIAIISIDADGDGWLPAIWLVASVLLGAGTRDFRFFPLSFLAILIALPFGLPADRTSDPVLPVSFAAAYLAVFSSALILLGAFARRLVDSQLHRRRTPRDSGVA